MPLNERDERALMWGGGVIAVLLLYLLFFRGGDSGPSVEPLRPEIVARQPAIDRPATYATPTLPTPMPPPVVVAGPVAVAPNTDVSQLRLYGLLSRGAVIGMADGTQQFVPIGREIAPGVVLRRIEVHHAILATGAGEVRLGFDSAAQTQAAVTPTR